MVMWTTRLIRLILATSLAMGRLIRSSAPTLRKQKPPPVLMTNLIALVEAQFIVRVSVIVRLFTVWCAVVLRNGEGVLLTIPRPWCRTEYLCLRRQM